MREDAKKAQTEQRASQDQAKTQQLAISKHRSRSVSLSPPTDQPANSPPPNPPTIDHRFRPKLDRPGRYDCTLAVLLDMLRNNDVGQRDRQTDTGDEHGGLMWCGGGGEGKLTNQRRRIGSDCSRTRTRTGWRGSCRRWLGGSYRGPAIGFLFVSLIRDR